MSDYRNNSNQDHLENENVYCITCGGSLQVAKKDSEHIHYICPKCSNKYKVPNNNNVFKQYRSSLYDAIEKLPEKSDVQYSEEYRDVDLQYRLYQAAVMTHGFTKKDSRFAFISKTIEDNINTSGGFPLSLIGQELYAQYKAFKKKKLRNKIDGKKKKRLIGVAIFFVIVLIAGAVGASMVPNTTHLSWSQGDITLEESGSLFYKLINSSVKLSAEKLEETASEYSVAHSALKNEVDKFELYDISLNKGEEKYAPESKVMVKIKKPTGYNYRNLFVNFIDENGRKREITSQYSSVTDTISFEINEYGLYAICECPYTVSFNAEEIGEVLGKKVLWGSVLTEPDLDVERTGYTFEGWYVGDEKWDFANDNVTQNITLTPKWTANTYTISYDLNGGDTNVEQTQTVQFDTDVTLMTPTRDGYRFMGWYDEEDTLISNGKWQIASNVNVTAKWERTYTITFAMNGGTPIESAEYIRNELTSAPSNPKHFAMAFDGWTYSVKGFSLGDPMPESDIIVSAKWKHTQIKKEYTSPNETVTDGETYRVCNVISNIDEYIKLGYNKIKITYSFYTKGTESWWDGYPNIYGFVSTTSSSDDKIREFTITTTENYQNVSGSLTSNLSTFIYSKNVYLIFENRNMTEEFEINNLVITFTIYKD